MDVNTHLHAKTKEELLALVLQHQTTITELEERIQKLLQEQYGTRSEKFVDPQADNAFDEAMLTPDELPLIAEAEADIQVPAHTRKKHGGGRKPLPAHLLREEIIYTLPEKQKLCVCVVACSLKSVMSAASNSTSFRRKLKY
jgi:hypothetical protein